MMRYFSLRQENNSIVKRSRFGLLGEDGIRIVVLSFQIVPLIAPVGREAQHLLLVERRVAGFIETRLDTVRFVPMLSGIEK